MVVVERHAAGGPRRLASCHEVVVRQHSSEATLVPEVRIAMPCRSTMWGGSVARLCGCTLGPRPVRAPFEELHFPARRWFFVFIPTSLAGWVRRAARKWTGLLPTCPFEAPGRTWTLLPATLTPSQARRASSARQWSTIAVVHSP